MDDPTPAATAPVAPPAPAASPRVSLIDFCVRLSGRSKQVELIAAFAHMEKAAGRKFDTEAAYASRFAVAHLQPA